MRRILTIATLSLALLGVLLASVPFLKSMRPSERVLSNLPRIELSGIEPGEYKFVQEHVFHRDYKNDGWGVLIIRKYNGEYDLWDIPYLDGKVGMPDISWWRIYEHCEKFGPAVSNGKVLETEPIACHDEGISEWSRQEWRWSFSGENLGKWTEDLHRTKGTIERGEFVFSKDS